MTGRERIGRTTVTTSDIILRLTQNVNDEIVRVSGLCVSVGRGGLDRGRGLRLGMALK